MATTKRVFVGFAVEDKQYRDLLRGQSKLGDSPIDYTDMSVKEPWDSAWKTKCRQRIRGCDGVIALLSQTGACQDDGGKLNPNLGRLLVVGRGDQ